MKERSKVSLLNFILFFFRLKWVGCKTRLLWPIELLNEMLKCQFDTFYRWMSFRRRLVRFQQLVNFSCWANSSSDWISLIFQMAPTEFLIPAHCFYYGLSSLLGFHLEWRTSTKEIDWSYHQLLITTHSKERKKSPNGRNQFLSPSLSFLLCRKQLNFPLFVSPSLLYTILGILLFYHHHSLVEWKAEKMARTREKRARKLFHRKQNY